MDGRKLRTKLRVLQRQRTKKYELLLNVMKVSGNYRKLPEIFAFFDKIAAFELQEFMKQQKILNNYKSN